MQSMASHLFTLSYILLLSSPLCLCLPIHIIHVPPPKPCIYFSSTPVTAKKIQDDDDDD